MSNDESHHQERTESSESNPDDDYLYICPVCSTVTYDDVADCPACGCSDDCLSLAIVDKTSDGE